MARLTARRGAVAGAVAGVTGGALALGACAGTPGASAEASEAFVLTGVERVSQIGQVTGADAPGDTTRFAVHHTDLGSMFEAHGKVWLVFGDTFAERDAGATGGGGALWRSNVLGHTRDDDPADGITLDGMITDEAGVAKEILPSKKIDGDEITVIPTHGFEAAGKMYLHYMSVRRWGAPGQWEVNEAGLARSTDEGKTWRVLDAPRWAGDSRFAQISPYHVTEDGTDVLYVWGIGQGRFGGASLARVEAAKVESPGAWRYFTGTDEDGTPTWSARAEDAALVVDDTVGELSVVHNEYLDRWIMTYLREGTGVVIREGISPWGPWGEPITMIGADELPGPYAPYMLDRYVDDGGRGIYFALSIWDPYNVFWYRAELSKG